MASPRASPSPASSNDPPAAPTVPDEDHGVDLPMSMTASVILTNLPKDASQALADVEALDDRKGTTTRLRSHLTPSVSLPVPQPATFVFHIGLRLLLSQLMALQYLSGFKPWGPHLSSAKRFSRSLLLRSLRRLSTFSGRSCNANLLIRSFYMSTVYLRPD
jgi:hypothetical protein